MKRFAKKPTAVVPNEDASRIPSPVWMPLTAKTPVAALNGADTDTKTVDPAAVVPNEEASGTVIKSIPDAPPSASLSRKEPLSAKTVDPAAVVPNEDASGSVIKSIPDASRSRTDPVWMPLTAKTPLSPKTVDPAAVVPNEDASGRAIKSSPDAPTSSRASRSRMEPLSAKNPVTVDADTQTMDPVADAPIKRARFAEEPAVVTPNPEAIKRARLIQSISAALEKYQDEMLNQLLALGRTDAVWMPVKKVLSVIDLKTPVAALNDADTTVLDAIDNAITRVRENMGAVRVFGAGRPPSVAVTGGAAPQPIYVFRGGEAVASNGCNETFVNTFPVLDIVNQDTVFEDKDMQEMVADMVGNDYPLDHLVLFGYGYSGSGKTFNLLGNDGKSGLLFKILGTLATNGFSITDFEVFEEIGMLAVDTTRRGPVGAELLGFKSENKMLKERGGAETPSSDVIIRTLADINDTRRRSLSIKATLNNKESSRSHLYTSVFLSKNGRDVCLTVIDLAGSENPKALLATMAKGNNKALGNTDIGTLMPTHTATLLAIIGSVKCKNNWKAAIKNLLSTAVETYVTR
ncbi:hypothetical protein FOA52_012829 [Chlamydomonas sp. UWO 241]|nr:hypothetical protein FOA52_012829 [Chlamydomonas sp. UWO 241]